MKNIFFTLFLITFILTNCDLLGQTIAGFIKLKDEKPVDFVNVHLMSTDSTPLVSTYTDLDGKFTLDAQNKNFSYLLVSGLGYKDILTPLPSDFSKPLVIIIEEDARMLDEIVVKESATKVEQKIDRLVLNIGATQAAGNSAIDILERSPGILVNRSAGTINMMGKDGVVVIMNGKISNMPTDVVLKMLEGMSATDLSKIELITTPPANFDAQGNAGYINIVTKNNPEQGWQGNTSINVGYGHGWNNLISANVQYRKDKFSTSMGANYAMDYRDQFTYVDRTYRGVDTYSGNNRKPFKDHINYRVGVNYDLNQKTSLGANFSGYLRLWDMTSNGTFRNNQNDTSSHLAIVETNDWTNQNYNINVKHAFTKNSTWSLDGDILHFSNDGFTDNTVQLRQDENVYGKSLIGTTKNTPFDINVLKSDYVQTIGGTKYSIGAKMTQTDFINDIDVKVDGTTLSEFASAGKFKENILAFYTTADFKPTDKVDIKLGVRYEATAAEFMEKDVPIYNKKYQNLFPSAFISYKLTEHNDINLQYSKRVERPAFSDISSFTLVNDPNFIFTGNATLQPSFSDNISIGSRFHNLNVQLQYSYTDESISGHQMKYDPITKIITRRPENLDYTKNITLSASLPVDISKNWKSRWFGAFLYLDIKDKNGLTYSGPSFQTNTSHTITLPAKTSIDLNALYFHKRQDGIRVLNPLINVNIAIKKQLQNDGILTLGVDDVFDTFKFGDEAELRQAQYLIKAGIDFSHTTFKVGYTHNFGNQKLKKVSERKEIDEEKRIQN